MSGSIRRYESTDNGAAPTPRSPATPTTPATPAPVPIFISEVMSLRFSIVKSFVGSAPLFLPSAFANAGLIGALAGLTAVAALSMLCMSMLIDCAEVIDPTPVRLKRGKRTTYNPVLAEAETKDDDAATERDALGEDRDADADDAEDADVGEAPAEAPSYGDVGYRAFG